jgi:hypothetical protein
VLTEIPRRPAAFMCSDCMMGCDCCCYCFGVQSVVRALYVGQTDSHSRRCKERIFFFFLFAVRSCVIDGGWV